MDDTNIIRRPVNSAAISLTNSMSFLTLKEQTKTAATRWQFEGMNNGGPD